ncbi:MAG TPA: PAS domain S-box protein [Rhodospirillaceae bacterium]|nr:PAS domain S-box protein [Rhodospirillaceae bacterium]
MTLMGRLYRLRLGRKLTLNLSILLLILLAVGGLGLYGQQVLTDDIRFLYEDGLLGLSSAKDAQIQYALVGRALRQALLAPDQAQRDLAFGQLSVARDRLPRDISDLKGRLSEAANRDNLDRFQQLYGAYDRDVGTVAELIRAGKVDEARAILVTPDFQNKGIDSFRALELVSNIKERRARQLVGDTLDFLRFSQGRFLALVGAGIVFGILAGFTIARSIQKPTEHLRQAVAAIAEGKVDDIIPYTDFPNETGDLARAIRVLQAEAEQMAAQRWIKTQQAEILLDLQSAADAVQLAQTFLSKLSPLLQAGYGVFYAYEEDARRLHLIGSYAFRTRKEFEQYYALGEGLAGQCAAERAPIILTRPPKDYLPISSGLIEAPPNAIGLYPVLRGERLMGVVELATFQGFGTKEQALLDSVMPILAVNLEILERNARTAQLLEETKSQSVRLETQQQALKATEAWYRGIIESAPDGIVVVDDRGVITMVNQQVDAMFEFAAGELTGQPIEILIPEAVRARHLALRDGFITDAKQGRRNMELRARRRDGSEFSVDVRLAKLPDLAGRGLCICATIRDITDRKRVSEDVDRQRATLSALISAIPDPIYYKDPEGIYLGGNEAFAGRVGKPLEEIIGRSDYDIFPPEAAFAVRQSDQAVLESGMVATAEEWTDFADGRRLLLDILRAPFHDAGGKLLGVVSVGRVITDRAPRPVEAAPPPAEEPVEPAPTPSPPPPAAALTDLPGIDVKAGMATTRNKESLYRRMLVMFRDGQSDFARSFAAARADADAEAATRVAHTLKGVAGSIGAKAVQAAAALLEKACKDGGDIDARLAAVLAELDPVMAGLAALEGGVQAVAAKPMTMPEDELRAALERLGELLRDSDTEAETLLGELMDKLAGTPWAGRLEPVAKAVDGYDFDAALAALEQLSR